MMRRIRAGAWLLVLVAACGGNNGDGKDKKSAPDSGTPDSPTPPLETGDTATVPTELHDTAVMPFPSTLDEGGVIQCQDSAARYNTKFDTMTINGEGPPALRMYGAGGAIGDLDGNGLKDILLLGEVENFLLMQKTPDEYIINPPGLLPDIDMTNAFGASVADMDDDGDLDVVITRFMRPDRLLLNDGTGHFTDVAEARGLDVTNHTSSSSSWGDYDADGDLDLVVGGYGDILEDGTEPSDFPGADETILYQNDGQGYFTDMRNLIPTAADLKDPNNVQSGYTFLATFIDVHNDGYPDLYLINDIGGAFTPGKMVWNNGGTFTVDDGSAGLHVAASGMGLGIGDTNGDGVVDFAVPAWGRVLFLESAANANLWVNVANSKGVIPRPNEPHIQVVGWGAELADMDNDTDLDIPVAFGFITTSQVGNPDQQGDALWLRQDDGTYFDAGMVWGVDDRTPARGLIASDLNNDGYLDLLKPAVNAHHLLKLSVCGDDAWMRVNLRQPAPNVRAVGARVRLHFFGRMLERTVLGGGTGYATGRDPEVHFGLGDADTVDRIEVIWPDGEVSWHEDVSSKQILTITR